jgi:hypothetical protein
MSQGIMLEGLRLAHTLIAELSDLVDRYTPVLPDAYPIAPTFY